MKKFMIFLLMTVLYLGTCQARSEASHPNNGKLKLLSWVSPTPSESFLTPAGTPTSPVDVVADPPGGTFPVVIVGAESACPGQTVALTAVVGVEMGNASTPVAFIWKHNGTAISGANSQIYEFNSSIYDDDNVHQITVEVTTGTTDCMYATAPPINFTVRKTKATISGPEFACAGADLTLTAGIETMKPAGQTITGWQWYKGDNIYATTTEGHITLPRTVIGTYDWHVVPILAEGPSCPVTPHNTWNASSVQDISVTGTLALNLSSASHTPMCEGDMLSLVPDNSGLTGVNVTLGTPSSYEWYMNGEHVATTTSSSPAYTTTMQNAGVYSFVVKAVYDNYDCSEIASNVRTVSVYAAPELTVTGDNVICAGQLHNYIHAIASPAAPTGTQYTWTLPDGSTTTASTENKVDANAPGNYMVTMTLPADNGGCTATAEFTVYQFGGDLQLTASNYYVCPGEVVALNANLEGWSNENIQYTWTIPTGATIQGATNASVATVQIDATSGTLAFTVKATANGIDNCEIEKTINVNVIAPTQATYTVELNKKNICEGDQVQATATLSGSGSYTGLLDWYVNGVQVPGEHATTITLNMDEAGTYTFAATPANTVCTNAVPSVTPTTDNTVTVHANPVVTIVGDHVICVGETPNNITAIPSVAANYYTWVAPNGATASDYGAFTLPATLSGDYLVTMTDANGCSASDQFTVTQLGADLQVYASETMVCPGTPVIFNANVSGWDNYDITYEWDHSLGTNPTVTVNTPATGSYTVTAFAKEGTVTVCQKTASVAITVIDETNPTFTVQLVSPTSQHMCEGSVAQYKAEVTAGTPATGWIWYLDGIEIPGQNLATVYVNLYNTGVHHFAAAPTGYNCINPAAKDADKTVEVHAVPEVTISGNNQICNGTTTNEITAHVIGGSGDYTYTWAVPVGVASASTTATQNANKPGVYTLTVKDNVSLCQTEVDFTVYQFGADLQVTADKMNICAGENVVLNANLDGFNSDLVAYAWDNGATTNMISVAPTTTTTYTVTATATGTACVKVGTIEINVTPVTVVKPTVTYNGHNPLCVGEQAYYFKASSGTSGLYVWYVDGAEYASEGYQWLTINFTTTGTHSVAAKPIVEGCYVAEVSEEVEVDVYATPVVTISGNNVICDNGTGNTADLTANVVGTSTYDYAWSDGSTTTAAMSTSEAGIYTVTVTDQNTACFATASVQVLKVGSDIQVIADKMNICEGEDVVLNVNADGFVNNNISYAWSTGSSDNMITVQPTTTDHAYSVTASVSDGSHTCSITGSIDINVTPVTVVKPTVDYYGNDPLCVGEQAYYFSVHDAGTYVWYVDGVEYASEGYQWVNINFTTPGTHSVAAKPILEGCYIAQVSDEYEVDVYASPVVTISGNNVICDNGTGNTADLTANVVGSSTYDYAWSDGSTTTAAMSTSEAGIYTVTVTDQNTACFATASVQVIKVGSDIQVIADKMNICEGEDVVLNVNADGFVNNNISYAWSTGSSDNMITVQPTLTDHVYTVTASVSDGSHTCSITGSIDINVSPIPAVVVVTPSSADICEGQQVSLEADVVAPSYIWYLNGIEIPGENQKTITMALNHAGSYDFQAKAVSAAGCVSASASAPATVTVHETPVVTITGDHYYTTGATSAHLTATVYPAGSYTYAWSNGESTSDITLNAPGGYGVYTVTVTSANGCVGISEPFEVSSVVDIQVHIAGTHIACQHDTITLTAIIDHDLEGISGYKWLVNGQYITAANVPGVSGLNTANLTFPVDSLYAFTGLLANEFTVEVVRDGCPNDAVSPVHPFLINPVPYVYVAAPAKVCKGNGTTLEAVVYQLGIEAQYQYIWFKDGVAVDTIDYINTYAVAADQIEGHTYAVQVIYQDMACNSDTSDAVTIEFYVEPQAITLSLDPTTICTTNQASVWITDPNTDPDDFGPVNYTWYVNGFEMPLAQGDTLVVDFDHNGAYTFWATAAYANYPCALAYTDTLTENVVMHPTVAITGDPIICHSDTINLYANINDTVGSMNYTYEWRLYNYSLEDITNNNIVVGSSGASNYVNNGNTIFHVSGADNPWLTVFDVNAQDYPYVYTVVVTTPEGCRVESEPYFVYVNDTIHVVATVDEDTVCAAGEVTLMAHLGNWNADNLTAQWQYSTDNGATWTDIAYGTSGILHHIPGEVIPSTGTVLYRIHVIQTTSNCEAYSDPVAVEVVKLRPIDHIVAINTDPNYPTTNVCKGAQLEIVAYVAKLDASGNPIQLKCADGVTDSVDASGNPVYDCEIDYNQTYVWKLNGINLNDVNEPVFSAQAGIYDNDPVDYVYSAFIVYNIPGCEIVEVASDTIHVRRNPIVIIEGNHNFCYFGPTFDNIQLTAWVDGDYDPDATYTWYKNGMSRTGFHHGYNNHYIERWEPSYDNPYEFTVEVTNGDGCTTISEIHYVNVYDMPVVNITADADSICENGSVTMRANLDNYNDPMLTFQWYRNTISQSNLIPGATHEIETFYPVLGSTKYIVEVTHLMDYNQTCIGYDTFEIKVNPIPVVRAEYRDLAFTTICDGRAVNIAAGVLPNTGIAGGEVYTWYRNGQVINGFNGDTLVDYPMSVDNEPAVYTYAVSVKQSASGCESEIFTLTPSITVNPNPALELTTDPIVCDTTGDNITLTANMVPTAVGSPLKYSWYEDNHLLAGFEVPTDTNAISFHKDYRDYPYSFSVKSVNSYGCISEASALVYVNAEPVVHITATEDSICVGGEVTLTATLNDWNADQLTFQWFDGTDSIYGATELSYTVVPTQGTHNYHVEILQLTSLCHATSNVVKVEVVPDPTITITYTANQFTVCDGYQVDLTTTVTGGVAGGEIYTWYRNGQVIEGATSASYSEVVSALNGEPTTYDYAVSVRQAAAGCESNVYDQLATITVNPNPVVVLVTDPIVCDTAGANIILTANLDPANVGSTVTFKWMEDNAIMNPSDYTVVADNQIKLHKNYRDYPYSFAVEVVNDYACSASSEAQVLVNAKPIVNITATETDICVGGEITLTATLNDWNADMLTFQWYDSTDLIPGATELSYTVVPGLDIHKYNVKVYQLTSDCQATSNVIEVMVHPDPVVTLVTISDTNVCNGAQITVAATIDAHGMDASEAIYTWYRNGILIPGATAATIQDNPATIDNNIQHYTYTAVVTLPQAGCTSAPTTSPAVNVYPNPVVVISGDAHVCETDSVFLIANVDTTAFAVGNLHFTWYESGTIHDNMAYNLGDNRFFAEYFYPRDEPYVFTVNVERDDITAACAAMSAEYYVYVYRQPLVTVTATETLVCTDGEVTLTANLADYNADNLIYQWYEIRYHDVTYSIGYDSHDNVIDTTFTEAYRYYIPGATMPTYTTNPHATTTYGVIVYQTNSTCWNNDEVTITVNQIPEVTAITVSNDTVCNGTQVTVSATIDTKGTPADGAVYTWYRNGDLIEGVTGASFSENVFTTDDHITVNSYKAVVTLPVSGCISLESTPNTVTILPAPTTVSISGNNVICENDSTILTVYSNVPGNITWNTGSHETSIKVPAGTYTVTVETLGCEMTSDPLTVEAFGTDLLVSASATSICRGEHTTLYVDQDGWQGNVTYAWDTQAGNSTATTVDVQPDSTTTYSVTATVNSTNGSCFAVGEVTIIVNQLPAAFAVTASADTICEGQQVTFTAPVDPQVTSYIWYQNGVEIPGENQRILTVNFNEYGNYTFAAKAISVEGCISAQASDPDTVTVMPAPTTVTITGHNILCMNDSTVLTAHSDVPGTFTWNDGTTGATNVVTAGVYNVTLTTAQGCSKTSDNFTVETFGTDLIVSASATSICRGEHTTLYVDQEGWQGNVTYAWDAQAGNSTASTVDVQPDSTTTYHVVATVTNENGSCTANGEITIIVNQLPVITGVTASDTVICQGDQVTFTATGDINTVAYIWYNNGVEIPGENQATLTVNFNEQGTYNYAVKAISNENCVAAVAYNAPVVTVKPAPTTVTITGNNILCLNDSTVLTAHSDVAGTFTWNDGTTGVTKVVTAGVYNVTLTTPEGCHLTSENITVESFGTDLLVSASATSICRGEHTTLYVDQDGWQGNVTYAWDAQAGNSTASTVDVQPDSTTTYHVVATVTNENGSCTANGEITIIVNQLPVITGVTASDTVICQGDQVTFTATGDINTVAYIWYNNGVEIPGENQATLTVNFNEQGTYNYAVKAISNENCVAAVAYNAPVVTVKPAPTTVTITGVNVLCENSTTTLTAHSDVAGTFTWNDNTTGATKVVPAGVYNVTLTTPEGCSMTSENFTVEAFGTDLIVSASATSICRGEHTTLSVDQNGWQGNVTYQWDAQAGNDTATTVDVQPTQTTTYHVTATVNSTNGSCQAEGYVTIIVNQLPVITAVTATDTVVCEGTQVTFTATGDASTTGYIWYNNGVEIPGENQAALTINFNEQGVYNYAVKAISNEGCISAIAFNAPAVTVNAAPASVTISGELNICDGGSTTLYANVVPNEPATYVWYKNNVAVNTTTEYLTVTDAGSYKVVASFNGCSTESDPVNVMVGETPQLQLTATESTICVGGTTVITAEATGPNNEEMNYNWSNGFQGSVYNFTPAYSGTHTFMVTVSQANNGCTAVDTISIVVNNIPATPVVTVDNEVVCDGGQITLTVANANANATYFWKKNGVLVPNADGAVLYDSPVTVDGDQTAYVYTVYAELPMSGCTSATSADKTVTVIPTQVVEVSVEGNTTLCVGGSTQLHANVTPANANYTYQWYKDNVLIDGANQATYVAAEIARETPYSYKVVVTANAGCDVPAYAPAITFVADPQVEAIISNNISCVGGTATLTAIVDGGVANVNGLNGYTFTWYKNDVQQIGNGPEFVTSATDAAGNYTYWVTVTSNYGCQSTSNVVNYSVVADPVVTIAVATGYPTTVCNGGESMLKANVNGGYGEATYQWYKNGNLLVGETNQTLSLINMPYGVNDNYKVEVMQTGVGCSSVAEAAINTLVTVNPTYTVAITGFGNVCEGGTLTLNATVNNGQIIPGDVLSYQWYRIVNGNDAVAIAGANAASYSTSDLLLGNSYDYYVVVTSTISGCSVVSNSVPANVVVAPTVAIQGANTVCEGGNLVLNAFVNGGVDGAAYTYTWNWTGAANGTATTAVPNFTPANLSANDLATPYYFTVTISRNDNTGCTATSAAHEVNILAVPTVSVTADNNYICQNGQVTFTAHVSPVGAYNYVWTINGQQQAENAASVTTTMATTGTINATVVVGAANASGSCTATASIAAPVQVVAAPTVTLVATDSMMCTGGVTTLTATVNPNANIPQSFNYEWIVDGTPFTGVTNNGLVSTLNQTLSQAGVHTYKVRVSQNNNLGCASTWSNQIMVHVAEQPVVTLSSEDGLAICEGGSITLSGVVTNYNTTVNGVTNSAIYGNLVFDWTSNGVNIHHNTSSTAMNQVTETLNNVGNYTYQVTVDAAGYNCQPQVSNEFTVNVVGDPTWTDVHVYSNNGTDACLGEMVYLMAAIEGGVSDYASSTNGHIQWVVTDANGNTIDVNGGLGGTSYDIPAAAGTYIYTPTYVGNIGSGCQLTNTNAVQVAVTVHELPTAEFTSGDGTALCANDPSASAALVITFTGVAPFTYEVVDNNNNVIAHATTFANTATIYVAPDHQTTYRINLISDNYCENPAIGDDITATVFVNDIEFTENVFDAACDVNEVTISFNMISGNPTAAFTVVYENGMQASGNIVNNTATFATPTTAGSYNAVITIDGCSYDIVVRVPMSSYSYTGTLPLMDQRWNDVIVVNCNPQTNGGHTFVGFQWYHNGVAIPGATYSNYQDKGGLNGFYSVELTEQDANGHMITYMVCEQYFDGVSNVKVYPVPANVRQEVTIELDLTSEQLNGAVLDIYSATGAHISHLTDLQPITKIEGFTAQGTYFGRILTGTNEIKTVKFIIVK